MQKTDYLVTYGNFGNVYLYNPLCNKLKLTHVLNTLLSAYSVMSNNMMTSLVMKVDNACRNFHQILDLSRTFKFYFAHENVCIIGRVIFSQSINHGACLFFFLIDGVFAQKECYQYYNFIVYLL